MMDDVSPSGNPPAKHPLCVCLVVFAIAVSFVSMATQVRTDLTNVYKHVSPMVVGRINGGCQKPLISKWNDTCQFGYDDKQFKKMFESWGLPATACKQENATQVTCKFDCDDIAAGTPVSVECERYNKHGNKFCQDEWFEKKSKQCDVTDLYEALLEIFQQARNKVCKADRLELNANAKCNLLLPVFVEAQHLIKGLGTALFMLSAIGFSRTLLQKSSFMRRHMLRAGLQWYAVVVNTIVIVHCFVSLEETCEPMDEVETDWLCTPTYDLWTTISQIHNSIWSKRVGQPSVNASGAYTCIKVSFSVGAAFTAIGLIGGIVDLFPKFIDRLDRKFFFLYEDMPENKTSRNLGACVYLTLWFHLPRVVRLLMSVFMSDVLEQSVLNLSEGGQLMKATLLQLVQSDPPSLVVMFINRFSHSNPMDIFQLEILCMLPAYLATARLLQYIGLWYPRAVISLPRFARQEWNGEEAPMPSDYQELKEFVHQEMRIDHAGARNPHVYNQVTQP